MSDSANVALVRSIVAASQRGDYSSAEWAHPEIEFVFADGPAPGSWKGPRGLADATRDWLSVWEGFRIAGVDEYRELDEERVLVLFRVSGRGKRSGVELGEVGAGAAQVFHIRGGKVIRRIIYLDRERAFADLGLGVHGKESRR